MKDLKVSLSVDVTTTVRGFAILLIFIFHVWLSVGMPSVFNSVGAQMIAVFLILSGYGINESFCKNGLESFWRKKLKIIVPYILVVALYDSLAGEEESQYTFFEELLCLKPTARFWFIGHLMKCYMVYYVARRLGQRFLVPFFIAFGLIILNLCNDVEGGQAFSFLLGVLISEKKNFRQTDKMLIISVKTMAIVFSIGLAFMLLKLHPTIHSLKGTCAFNYFLVPIWLSWGVVSYVILSRIRFAVVRFIGCFSLELYIVHMSLLNLICGVADIPLFVATSAVLAFLLAFVNKKIFSTTSPIVLVMAAIGTLFVQKYTARVTNYAYVCSAVFFIGYILIQLFTAKIANMLKAWHVYVVVLISVVLMIALQISIDPYSVNVDRWSAIYNFLDTLLRGEYPYAAQTHLNGYGSPLPFWQMFHLPFYLLGNVGLSLPIAFFLFCFALIKYNGVVTCFTAFCLLVCSPTLWYEAAVRSDMLCNFLIVALVIHFFKMKEYSIDKNLISIALTFGLLLSTRVSVAVPMIIIMMSAFLSAELKNRVLVVSVALMCFALTIIPFIVWNQMFVNFEYAPLILQTRQGYMSDLLLFIPLGLFLALNAKTYRQGNINSAIMLIVCVVTSFIHYSIVNNEWNILNERDITYFCMAMPFLVLAESLGAKVKTNNNIPSKTATP